jgi:HK97 family phage prohead protease
MPTPENKQREIFTSKFEVKEIKEDDAYFYFAGYASVFNNVDYGDDRMLNGAFMASIARNKGTTKLLWAHDLSSVPLGVVSVVEDNVGLFVQAKLPRADERNEKQIMPQLRVGSITDMSVGYIANKWTIVNGVRELQEVELLEVSLVNIGMNPAAKVTDVKSIDLSIIDDEGNPILFNLMTHKCADHIMFKCGECGSVISQCGCDTDKRKEYVGQCKACRDKKSKGFDDMKKAREFLRVDKKMSKKEADDLVFAVKKFLIGECGTSGDQACDISGEQVKSLAENVSLVKCLVEKLSLKRS